MQEGAQLTSAMLSPVNVARATYMKLKNMQGGAAEEDAEALRKMGTWVAGAMPRIKAGKDGSGVRVGQADKVETAGMLEGTSRKNQRKEAEDKMQELEARQKELIDKDIAQETPLSPEERTEQRTLLADVVELKANLAPGGDLHKSKDDDYIKEARKEASRGPLRDSLERSRAYEALNARAEQDISHLVTPEQYIKRIQTTNNPHEREVATLKLAAMGEMGNLLKKMGYNSEDRQGFVKANFNDRRKTIVSAKLNEISKKEGNPDHLLSENSRGEMVLAEKKDQTKAWGKHLAGKNMEDLTKELKGAMFLAENADGSPTPSYKAKTTIEHLFKNGKAVLKEAYRMQTSTANEIQKLLKLYGDGKDPKVITPEQDTFLKELIKAQKKGKPQGKDK